MFYKKLKNFMAFFMDKVQLSQGQTLEPPSGFEHGTPGLGIQGPAP